MATPPNESGAVPAVAGGSLPPVTASTPLNPHPMVQITPEQLDLLQKRGTISPEVAAMRKAQLSALDARMGLSGRGFAQMFGDGKPQLGARLPSPSPAPEPPKELKPEEKAWFELTKQVKWVNPREGLPSLNGLPTTRLPTEFRKLLEEMNPDKVKQGLVPAGWEMETLNKLNPVQQSVLARLVLMEQQAQQERMLQDPRYRAALQGVK